MVVRLVLVFFQLLKVLGHRPRSFPRREDMNVKTFEIAIPILGNKGILLVLPGWLPRAGLKI